jgi:toxin ParE1/3/4
MSSSRRLDYTVEAEADIREILQYTAETWGEKHRRSSAERLSATMQKLTELPSLGRARNEIAPGIRCQPSQQHMIYYQVTDQAILIVRVLHQKMDAARHIPRR